MFGTLRAGSLVYILNKGENPSLTIGQVTSTTAPHPKVQNNFMPMTLQQEQVMDLTIKVGDDIKTFSNINPNHTTIDTGAGGYTLSEDKTAIITAVEAFGTLSQNALNAIPYHQRVVEACKQMMLELNPTLQKEAERDQEFSTMRAQLNEMRTAVGEMTNLLKGVLTNNNPKNRKE